MSASDIVEHFRLNSKFCLCEKGFVYSTLEDSIISAASRVDMFLKVGDLIGFNSLQNSCIRNVLCTLKSIGLKIYFADLNGNVAYYVSLRKLS